METIYRDIAARTGGNIYIGVVGPVRTGKSTLIKRFMEQLVIPCIADPHWAARAKDELPQSGSGKTIMTSEPKFVPEEAVEITPDGVTQLKVRLIDSVGYMIPGAVGAMEEGQPRMVTTPWADVEIPMTEAAELGTKKVMEGHCSIGLVVTTDGTVTDIPRSDYAQAERRAIRDMAATGKPFLVVINSTQPQGQAAMAVREELCREFSLEPFCADCQAMTASELNELLSRLLQAFPMEALQLHMPRWLDALEREHPVKQQVYDAIRRCGSSISCLAQAEGAIGELSETECIAAASLEGMALGTGIVSCRIAFPEKLYYDVLSQRTGVSIRNDSELMQLLAELSRVRTEYDAISDALASVQATGYGVVTPGEKQLQLQKPELIKKGSAWGIKLKAGAPSIHMIRVDIDTEISPMVGEEAQTRALLEQLTGQSDEAVWQSHIFGKSVYDMVHEGMTAKLTQMPMEVREKFRGTLGRIVNEGANGLICLIL